MEELIDPTWNKEEVKKWAAKYFGTSVAEKLYAQDATGSYLLIKDRIGFVTAPYWFTDEVATRLTKCIQHSQLTKRTPQQAIDFLASAQLTREELQLVHSWLSEYMIDHRIVKHQDSRFDFAIPVGVTDPVGWTSLPEAPFLNREETLLTLLNDCYANFRLRGDEAKPMAAFIATSPGYGKTRLLLEWAIRVFHDTRVLHAFWNNVPVSPNHPAPPFKSLIDEIEEYSRLHADTNNDKFNRALFISRLHQTLKQSSVISVSADLLGAVAIAAPDEDLQVENVVDVICRKIMCHALCSRFRGRVIEYANTSVMIPSAFDPSLGTDKEWLAESGLLLPEGSFFSLFCLLMGAIDYEHKSFSYFGQPQSSPRIVLVNIDECQSLVKAPAKDKTVACYVLEKFYALQNMFVKYPLRIHVLMVGLVSTELEKLEDRTKFCTRIALPLDPLLSQSYCNTLCSRITEQPLNEQAQNIIRVLWKRSLGIPRAVQILHHVLAANKSKLSGEPGAKKDILARFTETAKQYFSAKGLTESAAAQVYSMTHSEWERLVVEASLCVQKKQTDIIGNTTYACLESEGTLLPFKFGTNTNNDALRQYTMPFHFYGETLGGLNLLKSEPKAKFTIDLLDQYIPSIGDIIGPDGSQDELQQEKACAVSLWARYKLSQSTSGWCKFADLIETWPSEHHYCKFDSITNAKSPMTAELFKEKFELLKESRSIIINENNSAFADVLIPILKLSSELLQQHNQLLQEVQITSPESKGNAKKKLRQFEQDNTCYLLVQCRSHLSSGSLFNEWQEHQLPDLMEQGHIHVLLAPNLSQQTLDEQSLSNTKWIQSSGRGWPSELFLFPYSDSDYSSSESEEVSEDEKENLGEDVQTQMSPDNVPVQPTLKRKMVVQGGGELKKPKVN